MYSIDLFGQLNLGTLSNNGDRDELAELLDILLPKKKL